MDAVSKRSEVVCDEIGDEWRVEVMSHDVVVKVERGGREN
jgi:hypothetical protein